jgi:hypothetical protein
MPFRSFLGHSAKESKSRNAVQSGNNQSPREQQPDNQTNRNKMKKHKHTASVDELRQLKQLNLIRLHLEDFVKSDTDTTYLRFLRLLADYRHLQTIALASAIAREESRIEREEVQE